MGFTEEQMDQILLDEIGVNIRSLQIEALKKFVVKSISLYGDTNKLNEANNILGLLMRMLEKRHIFVNQQNATYFELLKAAVLIHNLFYNGTLASLFEAREKLTPIAFEFGLPAHEAVNPIFEAVEGQLGADTPVPKCMPMPGQPVDLMAEACWFVSELHGGKKMPYFGTPNPVSQETPASAPSKTEASVEMPAGVEVEVEEETKDKAEA